MATEIPTYTLNDSTSIPVIGLGTYGLRGAAGTEAVAAAIGSGYRLLDTALNYENEREVGDGIRVSGIDRSEIIVTSKIPGRHHGYDETFGSFAESSTNLGLDVIDLYLIHWPLPGVDKYLDTWKAMIALRDEGKVRSIGVSNFTEEHLERIIGETGVAPAVNQVELHPYFPQAALRAFHERHANPHGVVEPPREPQRTHPRAASSSPSPTATASRRRRSCCAGTCSSAPSPFRSRRMPLVSARTSTCSASSSATTRSTPSPRSSADASGAATRPHEEF